MFFMFVLFIMLNKMFKTFNNNDVEELSVHYVFLQ